MDVFKLFYSVLLLLQCELGIAQEGRVKCLTSTNNAFGFLFLFKRGSDTSITQLAFADSTLAQVTALITTPMARKELCVGTGCESQETWIGALAALAALTNDVESGIKPDSINLKVNTSNKTSFSGQCTTNTVDSNGILQIGFDVSATGPYPCGISKAGNVYTITVGTVGNTPSAYRFQCDTGPGGNINNFPTSLNITTFETGNVEHRQHFRKNNENLRLQVVEADGNKLPALEANLGRLLKLRVIYDKVFRDKPDLWGRSFHIAFLEHNDAALSLQVITQDLGTVILVSGLLPGSQFSRYYGVKYGVETLVRIPDAYRQVSPGPSSQWSTSKRTIKVEVVVPHEFVAIKVISDKRTGSPIPSGAFMAHPDDILGYKYACHTGTQDQADGQVLVYGTQSSTTLTVNFNSFTIAGITINGAAVTVSTDVSLDENDVLYMQCGTNCKAITIQSDKPVGVITGHERQRVKSTYTDFDHMVSQLPPVTTFGNNFFLFSGLRYFIVLEDPSTTVDMVRPSGTITNVPSGTFIESYVRAVEEIRFTNQKVMLLWTPRSFFLPFTTPTLAEHQWSTRYLTFIVPGERIEFAVVVETANLQNIVFRDKSNVFNRGVQSFKLADVSFTLPMGQVSATPLYSALAPSLTAVRQGLVELVAEDSSSPFMVQFFPVKSGFSFRGFSPIGGSYSSSNPCVPSLVGPGSINPGIVSVPGDLIDNDCDGKTDEETNDGKDNDGDGKIDEDLQEKAPTENVGIYVDRLQVSNNAQFSNTGNGITVDILTNGCSVRPAGSAPWIQPFSSNTIINGDFDTIYVTDTPAFKAFYIITAPRVYFRADVGFCYGNLTDSRCQMSCTGSSGRKRRAAGELTRIETGLTLNITDANDNGFKEPCTLSRLYWIPPILLLLTIAIEFTMIGIFEIIRSKQANKREREA